MVNFYKAGLQQFLNEAMYCLVNFIHQDQLYPHFTFTKMLFSFRANISVYVSIMKERQPNLVLVHPLRSLSLAACTNVRPL